jgi:hypothetical protein
MSPPFVFHCRMDAHNGKECKERERGRGAVEMELEQESGGSMDLSSALQKYEGLGLAGSAPNFLLGNPSNEAHEKQGPARGPCNFLLGSAINDAAEDHVEMELEQRGGSTDAQQKYEGRGPAGGAPNFLLGNPSNEAHEKQSPAGGPYNFLLGSTINNAAEDHVEMESEQRGGSTDVQHKYEELGPAGGAPNFLLGNPSIEAHEKQGPAGGPRNFLLGSAINDAAADHDCASLLGGVVVLNDSNICHSQPSFDAVDVLDTVAYHLIDAGAKLHAEGIPHHRIANFSERIGQD